MGFFKIIESELNNIAQSVKGNHLSANQGISREEKEKLQGMLNNIRNSEPIFDVTQKKHVSARVNQKDVQDAIRYFNSLSHDERIEILEKAELKLQNKLMAFMEENAKYTDNIDLTNYLLKQLTESYKDISNRKSYTEKEMAVLVKVYQKLFAKCNIEADRMIKAFSSYRGDGNVNCGKICENNKDEYAISLCSQFKQAMNSYNQLFISNVQEILKASESSKSDFMNNLDRTIERFKNEIEYFQNNSRHVMNAFIPDVVQEENKFSRDVNKYAESGIPADLCLQNKVVENVLIDAMLEAAINAPVSEAA